MYEHLAVPAPDEILQLAAAYREDTRTYKVDLGIGVYRDNQGRSPVMRAIKKAEQLVLNAEDTKAYLGLAGDEAFNQAMRELLFGRGATSARASVVQTPGGSGAVRLLFELVYRANPAAKVWISDPSWSNHQPMAEAAGLAAGTYRYLDRQRQALAFEQMMADLQNARKGDIVVLHACCHNPTGVNLTIEHWRLLAEYFNRSGAIPMVDIAYQGLGEGLDEDVQGLRHLAENVQVLLLAASCSKSFGLYRDRVGCAVLLGNSPQLLVARANLLSLARVNYSFPPDHGAAVVRTVWNDASLRSEWSSELEDMRVRLQSNRGAFASAMALALGNNRFDFIRAQTGMFSLLGLSKSTIEDLRASRAIFMPSDGRINVAGLTTTVIASLSDALQGHC